MQALLEPKKAGKAGSNLLNAVHGVDCTQCPVCYQHVGAKNYRNHRTTPCHKTSYHLANLKGIYFCFLCSSTFPEQLSLKDHLTLHTPEELKDWGYDFNRFPKQRKLGIDGGAT